MRLELAVLLRKLGRLLSHARSGSNIGHDLLAQSITANRDSEFFVGGCLRIERCGLALYARLDPELAWRKSKSSNFPWSMPWRSVACPTDVPLC